MSGVGTAIACKPGYYNAGGEPAQLYSVPRGDVHDSCWCQLKWCMHSKAWVVLSGEAVLARTSSIQSIKV